MRKIVGILAAVALLLPAVSFAAFDQNISYGSTGSKVTELQNFLTTQGFYKGPITGNFYSLTKSAIIAFQKQKGIQPATGLFGPLTRGAVNNLLVQNASNSASSSPQVPPVQTQPTQQVVVPPSTLPLPTTSQIAGIMLICSTAISQGNTQVNQYCTDGTLWNGYNSNAIFRNNIDGFAQQIQQKLTQQQTDATQRQASCIKSYVHPYDSTISSAANSLISQMDSTNLQVCLTGNVAAWQQAQQQIQQSQSTYQLQQLQSSIDSNTRAIQQQQNTPTYTPPASPVQMSCNTQPWWDTGVLRFKTTCGSNSY